MLLPSTTYMMVYVVIIPLGIVGLVHVTRTALLLIVVIVLMVGGVDTVKQSHTHIVNTISLHGQVSYMLQMLQQLQDCSLVH